MPGVEFNCLPTIIGSMPHTDPAVACAQIMHYLRDIPAWPQLSRRSFLENMYVQYSQGFPGVVVDEAGKKIYVNRQQDLVSSLEKFYSAFLDNKVGDFAISTEYAAGFYEFLALDNLSPRVVKGHVTGPVTWGLTVVDEEGKGILYDDVFGDAVPKLLRMKAAWQERELKKLCPRTIIFIDEPYMSAFGSVAMMLSREKVVSLLNEVFGGIEGLKGVHCCGNTDWSVILESDADIISFDAYNYAQSLSLYPGAVKKFLDRDGTLIHHKPYLCDPEDVEVIPGVPEALAAVIEAGYLLFLFTNQSGIGRDYYTLGDVRRVNARMIELIALPQLAFTAECIAPEHPDGPQEYRKPSPKFILEMIGKHELDPSACYMVGDAYSDVLSAVNAGIVPVMVQTGKKEDPKDCPELQGVDVRVFADLATFVRTGLPL